MKLTIRQMLGVGLLALAELAIAVEAMRASPPSVQVLDGGSMSIGPMHVITSTEIVSYRIPHFIPLLLAGLPGFLLWPARNPRGRER